MSGSDRSSDGPGQPVDEFDVIARLMRPLAAGAPEALGLADDAAVLPGRPGFDLVVSKDAMVCGVHFLPDDPLDLVAGKLLRTNLSDLAAKGAEPYGYFLAVAWSQGWGWRERRRFAEGLAADQHRFGIRLFGGDTVSTPGPFTASLTILGWVPQGRMIQRRGARPGDLVLVTGSIGDGTLGLEAARGGLDGLAAADRVYLADRYRSPQPRMGLGEALRAYAHAAADVSDGLLADAGHLAEAGDVAIEIDLDRMPLSTAASAWLAVQPDRGAALAALASGGDDYEIVCTAAPADAAIFVEAVARQGVALTPVGRVREGQGVSAHFEGRPVVLTRRGYRHGGGDKES